MPRLHAVSKCVRAFACVALLALESRAGLAATGAAAAPTDSSRVTASRPAQSPTSSAQMGISPRRSHRNWLLAGLGALAVGAVVALAGGGDSTPSAPVPPLDPPPPPPAN